MVANSEGNRSILHFIDLHLITRKIILISIVENQDKISLSRVIIM